ncbi:MAG: Crp/Fnr family transcriptional regulator [Brachymonas sp.]|nr:Crp/Fnr family transcriptional regulator [Brachymonas sp.]NJS35628.1 Crp/Fnr family transcriptional regulator [Brachymonas sp.]
MTKHAPEELSLSQRRRSPTEDEMRSIPWLQALEPQHQLRARAALQVGEAKAGDYVVRVGRPVTYWFGLIDGLLKMSNETQDGRSITLIGVPPGGWFGEGTVLKQENYRYNIQALRPSTVAGIPVETFHWLLDQSIAFNRFVMNQLNERVGQFITARESDRMSKPEARVASGLASLFNPVLYPGASKVLRITQLELANLVGLSRQRVNQALSELEQSGLVSIEYGGLRVGDLDALRKAAFA